MASVLSPESHCSPFLTVVLVRSWCLMPIVLPGLGQFDRLVVLVIGSWQHQSTTTPSGFRLVLWRIESSSPR